MKPGSSGNSHLTHFDESGNARMVDVGSKPDSERLAVAAGEVRMGPATFDLVRSGGIAKGDVLGLARVAGIMAAKKTPELIPLAHPIMISKVEVEFTLEEGNSSIGIIARVGSTGKTGVEMEALHCVTATALTIYDMCKGVDRTMTIERIRLLEKSGGRSGHYQSK